VIAATAGEAPYVLDGLLYHQTGLTIEEHYTDTGGASDHVFGLMPFFGYRFAPRLRDIKASFTPPSRPDRPLARRHDGRTDRIGSCRGALGRTAAVRHVDPHRHRHCFGDAAPPVRLSATERTGPRATRAGPSRTLHFHARLAARHRPAPAHPGGPQQGKPATRSPALFFNQLGELRDRRFENQTYRASGLNLLVAAIILWNTRYLEMALADIGTADEIARHIAPLGWEHISLTGDYSWNVEDRPDPDALRPLRAVSSLLAA
jgi:hypothetical protein